jgi:hypothetical protein
MARLGADSVLAPLLAFVLFVLMVAAPALAIGRVWAVMSNPKLNRYYKDHKQSTKPKSEGENGKPVRGGRENALGERIAARPFPKQIRCRGAFGWVCVVGGWGIGSWDEGLVAGSGGIMRWNF